MTRITSGKTNFYPFYSPRFWAGMKIGDYRKLLAAGHYRIHPLRYPMTMLVAGCALLSSGLSRVQHWKYDRKIADVRLDPPVFVIGHWRSGTTLLHEMLALDSQFTYPTTFQCFVPAHFLVSQPFLEPLLRLLLPRKRPMDAMAAGVKLPQEDEFALLGMGAPTPYRYMAFCNEPAPDLDLLNSAAADSTRLATVLDALEWFYKSVSVRSPGRLVVKSPTHTGRIDALAERFPGARFVHISRHPHRIFPSTVHLWRSLARVQGYQFPPASDEQFLRYANECYSRMYDGYFAARERLPENTLLEIRFEDLVANPFPIVRQIYDTFNLPGYEQVLPTLQQSWSDRQGHRTNPVQLDESTRSGIDRHWGRYMDAFGYDPAGADCPVVEVTGNRS